jgi:hypothetical protein
MLPSFGTAARLYAWIVGGGTALMIVVIAAQLFADFVRGRWRDRASG